MRFTSLGSPLEGEVLPANIHGIGARLALLLPLLAGGGCAPDEPVDDDDITPPGVDDDDVTGEPAEPTLAFDPSSVRAGDLVDVIATVTDFDLDEPTYECCADDDVIRTSYLGQPSPDSLELRFFFGLRASGTASWGMDNGVDQIVAEFDIEPLGDVPELSPGSDAGAGLLPEPGDFGVFGFDVSETDTFVALQVRADDPDICHPWLWVLGDDGRTSVAAGGFEDGRGGYHEPYVVFRAAEAGPLFFRVQDNHFGGGLDFGYAVDLATIEPGPPTPIAEIEPNSSTDEAQDLGGLAIGRYELTGVAETAGHDSDDELDGNLDVFALVVEQDARVRFVLDWAGEDDLDAVLYDDTGGETTLGFGSEQAMGLSMASARHPETGTWDLAAGTPYLFEVGNWSGEPGTAWTLAFDVMPGAFPD